MERRNLFQLVSRTLFSSSVLFFPPFYFFVRLSPNFSPFILWPLFFDFTH